MSTQPSRWTRAPGSDLWVDPVDDLREPGSSGTDERSLLLDHLRRYRLTLVMKCADLDAEQVEEYARHCGHADLLRERLDGRVGQSREVGRGDGRRSTS